LEGVRGREFRKLTINERVTMKRPGQKMKNLKSFLKKVAGAWIYGVITLGLIGGLSSQADAYSGSCKGLSAGVGFTCVLKSNGNVDCYGRNDAGQAEDYTGGDAAGVAAGTYHTCVLKWDGNVDCYGLNDVGQAED
jgi:hypothetical protein